MQIQAKIGCILYNRGKKNRVVITGFGTK